MQLFNLSCHPCYGIARKHILHRSLGAITRSEHATEVCMNRIAISTMWKNAHQDGCSRSRNPSCVAVHTTLFEDSKMDLLQVSCNLPKACHPCANDIIKNMEQYAHNLSIHNGVSIKHLLTVKSTLLTCNLYPMSNAKRVQICAMGCLWGWLIDIIVDSEESLYDAHCYQKLLDQHLQIMEGGLSLDDIGGGPEAQCLQVFFDFWRGICSHSSNHSHIASSIKNLLFAIADEFTLRSLPKALNLDSFLNVRKRTTGVCVFLAFLEFVTGIEISDQVWEGDSFQQLRHHLSLYQSFCNDLFSFCKEREIGDVMNTPSIIMIERVCGLREAVKEVCRMVEQEELNCKYLLNEMINSTKDASLLEFLHCCEYLASGYFHWSYETSRYKTANISFQPSTLGDMTTIKILPSWGEYMEWSTLGNEI